MNIVFFIMLTASIIMLIFNGPNLTLPAMINGANQAITLCITLLAIYCVWLAVLKVMEATGLSKVINKLFKPVTKWLFKSEDEETQELISLNFSANMLGMGGAATPLGIKAIERMGKDSKIASDNIILFVVINCTSLQLLPATIIGMRSAEGSANPADIILPTLIATLASTVVGVLLCKVISAFSRKTIKKTIAKKSPLKSKLAKEKL